MISSRTAGLPLALNERRERYDGLKIIILNYLFTGVFCWKTRIPYFYCESFNTVASRVINCGQKHMPKYCVLYVASYFVSLHFALNFLIFCPNMTNFALKPFLVSFCSSYFVHVWKTPFPALLERKLACSLFIRVFLFSLCFCVLGFPLHRKNWTPSIPRTTFPFYGIGQN